MSALAACAAPRDRFWSYTLFPFGGQGGYRPTPLAISSDGPRIIEGAYRAVLAAEGFRLSGGIEWHDTRRRTLAPRYYFAQGGFGWQGELCRLDGEELERLPVDASSLEGPLHREREWRTIGLSAQGRYALRVRGLQRPRGQAG